MEFNYNMKIQLRQLKVRDKVVRRIHIKQNNNLQRKFAPNQEGAPNYEGSYKISPTTKNGAYLLEILFGDPILITWNTCKLNKPVFGVPVGMSKTRFAQKLQFGASAFSLQICFGNCAYRGFGLYKAIPNTQIVYVRTLFFFSPNKPKWN